ncbi:MAG: toll/interleukin-1 receptor domain-containing protein [Psychroserpens sp.]|uniref:toll/interleukin-1 receptor domain-containing protein n=1 Tax=Psychroserpens sp. TaxID=2020870 RepID=UPI0030018FB3
MNIESIFVSYSSKDRPFALGLTKELQSLGANVWIDQLGIKLGQNWDNAIDDALESADTVILIISPTAVSSQNVQDEVSIAINENKKFVPIMIKECDLPMRWQRRQYADLINNPDKAIGDILEFLGIEKKDGTNLKNVISLIGVSEAQPTTVKSVTEDSKGKTVKEDIDIDALLVSEAEIDRAIVMHQKGIKKNWQLIAFVGIISLLLMASLLFLKDLALPKWTILIGCISINLLSIRPYGSVRKRIRNIDLMSLLKLKRDRLTRVLNKLTETEIDAFSNEFLNYIKA